MLYCGETYAGPLCLYIYIYIHVTCALYGLCVCIYIQKYLYLHSTTFMHMHVINFQPRRTESYDSWMREAIYQGEMRCVGLLDQDAHNCASDSFSLAPVEYRKRAIENNTVSGAIATFLSALTSQMLPHAGVSRILHLENQGLLSTPLLSLGCWWSSLCHIRIVRFTYAHDSLTKPGEDKTVRDSSMQFSSLGFLMNSWNVALKR